MKRISLLFIFLILLSGLGTAGDFLKQSNKKRKVPIKSTTGVPVFRSPLIPQHYYKIFFLST